MFAANRYTGRICAALTGPIERHGSNDFPGKRQVYGVSGPVKDDHPYGAGYGAKDSWRGLLTKHRYRPPRLPRKVR